ncbi:calumenin-B isoform X1 [Hydra vulgaris]|uniref:calumenin-B isoform X1 n=1 Tax=Hydra vulgaris TaxID=6087 RepID=UPI0006412296|nr:calumenin-B [Hydra vulgaris]
MVAVISFTVQLYSSITFFYYLNLIEAYNRESDHEAFLGAFKKEYDNLSSEESKRRLRLLLPHIDINKDQYITNEELKIWVQDKYESLVDISLNDAVFNEVDHNFNSKIDWDEYQWGKNRINNNANDSLTAIMKEHLSEFISRDKLRWEHADLDKDTQLNEEEYAMFQSPKKYAHMITIVAQEEIKEYDLDKDGKLSLEEFIASIHMPNMRAYYEKQFRELYDQDGDGKLDHYEVVKWMTPEVYDKAELEAKHLIDLADDNKDGKLTVKEILSHYFVFVGSKATKMGQLLHEEF